MAWHEKPFFANPSSRRADNSDTSFSPCFLFSTHYSRRAHAHTLGKGASNASIRETLSELQAPAQLAAHAKTLPLKALPFDYDLVVLSSYLFLRFSRHSLMKSSKWVRLEEHLPEIERMAEENRARAEGKILIDVENEDWIQSQVDAAGRKTFSRLTCATGGTIKVYFARSESEATLVPQGEEGGQKFRIVRRASTVRSPSASRLGSVVPRASQDEVQAEVERAIEG